MPFNDLTRDPRTLPVGRPAVTPHFAPVAEADWTLAQPWVGRVLPCQYGTILAFECQNVDLPAFLPLKAIGGGAHLNDIWGWTDSATGREFAIVGRTTGTSFVEIPDPVNPRYLGQFPLHAGAKPSTWRGMKVYQRHAFIVADAAGIPGMQVFDLTQLRTVTAPPVVFQETAHYDGFENAHTLTIHEATGFAYAVGSNGGDKSCNGGLHMIDVRAPVRPVFSGCYNAPATGSANTGYTRDAHCLTYRGA